MTANGATSRNGGSSATHTQAQRYLSTRGEDEGDLSFPELAFEILSLYISRDEIPADDLRDIINRSYATFRAPETTPLVHLRDNLYLLELFHGPTFAFKDVALQFLGNLFEYFLVRKNKGKTGRDRHHLSVVGATSGDTGSAAIYGLRGKKDVSVFILHPKGRVSPIQESQMTTVLDENVHNLAVTGTFDDCQDIVKALFADKDANESLNLGAVNSINWARILAQIVYYFHSYFSLTKQSSTFKLGDKVRFTVPTGNFGDILAGYFALRMGLPVDKLIVATNENDILDRFWKSGKYEKKVAQGTEAVGGLAVDGAMSHPDGVKETLSPAMDILVSSNFERLLWFLAYEFASSAGMDDYWNKKQASQEVSKWLRELKETGAFGPVYQDVLSAAKRDFDSERVTDSQTIETIQEMYHFVGYVLDPHSSVGIAAAQRSMDQVADKQLPHISLATAHPAKFSGAVDMALRGEEGFDFEKKVLPSEFVGLEKKEKRVSSVDNDFVKVRELVKAQVEQELKASQD
ncbi:threonine synthase [Geosmithia morbida]|uniref:threonine synthase n=1 Tax=Geosmithia morbida TaxID=1094350 RepID=A0A9P5D840_9HYPO|nr:threonine synthase [Geosmithia morbida]KAF4126395.1 threonine synthase [Geosmithia morbida]